MDEKFTSYRCEAGQGQVAEFAKPFLCVQLGTGPYKLEVMLYLQEP